MNCANCGKEIPDDSEFCGYCGASAAAAAAAAPQAPPPPPTPPSYVPPPPPPPPTGATPPMGTGVPPVQYGPPPAKKSPLPWILGILGVLVIGAVVVLLLGFAVGPKWFAGDDNGGGNGKPAENPEATVEAFFESMEKQDAKMLLGTMEPDFVEGIKDALGEDYLDLMEEYFFAAFPEDLKIDIEKIDSEIMGDEAEVTIEEGTMSYTDEYGDKITEDVSSADMDAFELVKVDGKWYLAEDTLIDMGFDFSGLEGTDFEDGTSDGDIEDLVELPVDSEDEVLTILFEEDEIWDWYMETDYPTYDVTEESGRWVVHFYELDEDGNEINFAYYEVDKETGEVGMITNE